MMHFSFSRTGFAIEREHRVLHQNFVEISPLTSATNEEYGKLKEQNPGVQEFVDHFIDHSVITDDDIEAYLKQKKEQNEAEEKSGAKKELTDFEKNLLKAVEVRKDDAASQAERERADNYIQKLVDYMKKRQTVVYDSHKKLLTLAQKQKQLEKVPPAINWTTQTAKSVIGTCWEGFRNASGSEKAIMLAGVISAVLMTRFLYNKMPGKGVLKNTLGIGLGIGVTYLAFEAMNKAVEKTTGKPILKTFHTQEGWDKQKNNREIAQIRADLRSIDLPSDLLQKIAPKNKEKYIKSVANFSTMDVSAFGELYNKYKAYKEIPENDPLIPHRPFVDDRKHPEFNLTPLERYDMVVELGKTLNLINDKGEFEAPKDKQDKSMLYMMLDWRKQPEDDKKK